MYWYIFNNFFLNFYQLNRKTVRDKNCLFSLHRNLRIFSKFFIISSFFLVLHFLIHMYTYMYTYMYIHMYIGNYFTNMKKYSIKKFWKKFLKLYEEKINNFCLSLFFHKLYSIRYGKKFMAFFKCHLTGKTPRTFSHT